MTYQVAITHTYSTGEQTRHLTFNSKLETAKRLKIELGTTQKEMLALITAAEGNVVKGSRMNRQAKITHIK